jgi:hypothetical protein
VRSSVFVLMVFVLLVFVLLVFVLLVFVLMVFVLMVFVLMKCQPVSRRRASSSRLLTVPSMTSSPTCTRRPPTNVGSTSTLSCTS